MISPDYETLYAFEAAIEEATRVVLTTKGLLTTFTQRSTGDLVTPRAEVQLSVGAARNHDGEAKDGRLLPDHFNGTLRIRVVTSRDKNAVDHSPYLARVRKLMYRCRENFQSDLLPYHEMFDARETGSSPEVSPELREDNSVITFAIWFGIRPDAWPHAP